jgi:hypothetical protein
VLLEVCLLMAAAVGLIGLSLEMIHEIIHEVMQNHLQVLAIYLIELIAHCRIFLRIELIAHCEMLLIFLRIELFAHCEMLLIFEFAQTNLVLLFSQTNLVLFAQTKLLEYSQTDFDE